MRLLPLFVLPLVACTAATPEESPADSEDPKDSGSDGTTEPSDTDPDPCADPPSYADGIVQTATIAIDSSIPHLADGLVTGDTLVLVGQDVDAEGSIWTYDISDPDAPELLDSAGNNQLMGACWAGELGYAIELHGGVRSFTLEDGAPVLSDLVGEGDGGARIDCSADLVAWGRAAAGGEIALVGAEPLEGHNIGGHVMDMLVEGDVVWALGFDGLAAYDLSSGTPVLTGSADLGGSCNDLAAHTDFLVAACGDAGVVLVDRGAGSPSVLGSWVGHAAPRTVTVAGEQVLVSAWSEWVLLDVTDPALPVIVGTETAPTAASAAVAHEGDRVYLVDWKRPSVATVAATEAPEVRLDHGYVRPGDVVRVDNDGSMPLCLETPEAGSLDTTVVAPGEAAYWTLPEDAAEGTVLELHTNDADEAVLSVEVGSLQGLTVGEPAPDWVEVDIDGVTWSLEALRGTVVFLGLLDAW